MTDLLQLDAAIAAQAAVLLDAGRERGLKIVTAESCTGGLLATVLTAAPGSSDVFDRGFVTYSDAAKTEMLGVPAELIKRKGAVSEEVARAMAEGALSGSRADLAAAITGIAGPGGGSAEKPVGLVHFAVARREGPTLHQRVLLGDIGRGPIRSRSVEIALRLLSSAL